jgi:hypothetical protein
MKNLNYQLTIKGKFVYINTGYTLAQISYPQLRIVIDAEGIIV